MQSIIEKQQKWLLRKFHALCSKAGLNDDQKYAMIASFGHESSKDMSASELTESCRLLEEQINSVYKDQDVWRKRLMASIGGWLKVTGREQNPQVIKSIACRAGGVESFNQIPLERLRNLYYAFVNKQKDFKCVDDVVKEDLDIISFQN